MLVLQAAATAAAKMQELYGTLVCARDVFVCVFDAMYVCRFQ